MYYGPFHETPGRLIRGVRIHAVASGNEWTLCKKGYCKEYQMDETSVSTATAQPQPDMLVKKHHALTEGGVCQDCGKEF